MAMRGCQAGKERMVNRLSIVAATLLAATTAMAGNSLAAAAPAPGRIAISVNLQADSSAAARTWRFEVADANGTVVRSVSIPLSGEVPSATMAVDDLPAGDYVVRPVFSADLGLECAKGALFRVNSEAALVPVRPTGAGASFTITPCHGAIVAMAAASSPDAKRAIGEPTSAFSSGSGTAVHPARNLALLAGALTVLTVCFAAMRFGMLRRMAFARADSRR